MALTAPEHQAAPAPSQQRPRVPRSTLAVVGALLAAAGAFFLWARVTAPPTGISWGPLDSIVAARSQGQLARPAPDFVLSAADGQTVALGDLRGQVVLVNFWATWCEPCRAEMAELDRLAWEYAPQGFRVVGVNLRESPEAVQSFADEIQVRFPLLADPEGAVYQAYGVMGLPTSYLVDADGIIRDVHLGVVTRGYLAARLPKLLPRAPS